LSKFENKLGNKEEDGKISWLKDWRINQYSHYSEYVHNSFFVCVINSYGIFLGDDGTSPLNIWGAEATRIVPTLRQVNDLMYWASMFFLRIIRERYLPIMNESLIEDTEWAEIATLFLMAIEYHTDNLKRFD
jgi:hypothetical protein